MIPTFNCTHYLAQALASVLCQDPGPEHMQIEVVDDHSSDDPRAVVDELGRGRVGFVQQERNVGTTRNFATALQRSRGVLVHLLHGDDCVEPGFYARMQHAFECEPGLGAAFCRHFFIDAQGTELGVSDLERPVSGLLDNALVRLASEQRIMTPSIVVRREVYETLGGFDERLRCSEDWEMWVRIAARYPIWYETAPLARYRMHRDSNTGRHLRSAEDMSYTRLAIEIFSADLPPDRAASIVRSARETYAFSALRTAKSLLAQRDFAGARAQLLEALRFSRSPRVLAGAARAMLQGSRRALST
jgi:glycosyltransferase involved in cell wall biosynthesis